MSKLDSMNLTKATSDVVSNDIDFAVRQTRRRLPTEYTAYVVTKEGQVVVCPRQDSTKDEWSAHVGRVIGMVKVDSVIFCGEALNQQREDIYAVKVEMADRYVIGVAPMTKKAIGAFTWTEVVKG
jgi:hypothetical protein